MVNESLYEFAKRGRPRKGPGRPRKTPRGIEASDAWGDVEDDEVVDPNDFDLDTSDMENAEIIEIEDDVFDDKLLKALTYETKVPEYSRRALKFKLKNDPGNKIQWGVPMAKIGDNAFLFKLEDGKMKKIFLRDIIAESDNTHKHRAKMVSENIDADWWDQLHNEPYDVLDMNWRGEVAGDIECEECECENTECDEPFEEYDEFDEFED